MEPEYLQTVERHKEGTKGRRSVDTIAQAFATLVDIMDRTGADILGDVFQGAITYGERGQFMTPEPVCRMMALLSLPEEPTDLDGRRTVCDPCCGSGRMLLAAAEMQPHWQFVGQDVDLRCVRMTAINLSLRNRYGHVVWGNSLGVEAKLVYETGRKQVWGNVIRKVGRVPLPDRDPEEFQLSPPAVSPPVDQSSAAQGETKPSVEQPMDGERKQLFLF
ncbi:MAG: N-6 DNA methylase [Planctomycetaceae bacterium]